MVALVASLVCHAHAQAVPDVCYTLHGKSTLCLAGNTALALYHRSGLNSSQTNFVNTSSIAAADDDYFAASSAMSQGLSQLQLSMGTAAPSSVSLLLEPAFFPEAGMHHNPMLQ